MEYICEKLIRLSNGNIKWYRGSREEGEIRFRDERDKWRLIKLDDVGSGIWRLKLLFGRG